MVFVRAYVGLFLCPFVGAQVFSGEIVKLSTRPFTSIFDQLSLKLLHTPPVIDFLNLKP